jgi:hypothetical protein
MSKRYRYWPSASRQIITLAALATVPLPALTPVATARAGTYLINDCPAALPGDYTVGPWAQFGTLTAPGSFKQTCVTASDSFGIASNGIPSNATAGEELQAPPAIAMEHIKLWWRTPAPVSGGGWSYALVDVYSPGWSRIFQSTTPMSADGAGGTAPTELSLPTNTTKVNVEVYCTNSENCGYNEDPLEIYGSQITLVDSGMPKGSVTGGSLAGAGPVSGTQSLAYDAEDTESGVRVAELLVDGQPVSKHDYLAECPYNNFAACPTSVSSLISWNTSAVSAGSHEVALRIVSAAGNAVVIDDHTIAIDNPASITASRAANGTAAVGPGSPAALRGSANGVNASDQAKLTAHWTSTAKEVRTSSYGAAEKITGRLTTATGEPISGALLDVSETPSYEGADAVALTNVRTGPTGEWSLSLPPRVSSSTLHFAYRSHVDDTEPVATATLTLRVHAAIALRIAPHIAAVNHSIVFSGAVRGTPIPPAGKQLVLEASSGSEWIQFNTIRTNAKGGYRASYRFKFPGPIRYQFRVLSRFEAGFPFLDGTSNTVSVYER